MPLGVFQAKWCEVFLGTLTAFVGVLAAFMKFLVTTFSVSLTSMGLGASKRNGFWVIVWASLSLGAETHETIDTSADGSFFFAKSLVFL